MQKTNAADRMICIGWNLQLFADAAAGASAAPAPAAESGEATAPAAGERGSKRKADPFENVEFGIDPATGRGDPAATGGGQNAAATEGAKSFDELIKGEYKKDFDAKVQDILGKRFKSAKASEEKLAKLAPMLEQLAGRYGVAVGNDGSVDVDALGKALDADDTWMEQQAAERGMSLETYKTINKLETEAKRRERQDAAALEEQQRRAAFDKLVAQAEQARSIYPGFNLEQEINNPAFMRLTSVGVDAKTAYEVIHKDEILAGGMQYAAQTAAQRVADAVQAGQRRPSENGLGGSAPAKTRITDPTKLTKAQRAEIRRRVARGDESISF